MISRQDILSAFRDGTAVSLVFNRIAYEDDETGLLGALNDLHNAGEIDVLSIINSKAFQELGASDFFLGQHLLCKLIPMLNSEVVPMMQFVSALVEKGGHDLAANGPNSAFRTWCGKHAEKSREVIELASTGDALASDHLAFALVASHAEPEAKLFARTYNGQRRWASLTALGQIEPMDRASRLDALATMRTILEEDTADATVTNVLSAMFGIVDRKTSLAERHWIDVLFAVCAAAGDMAKYQLAQCLWAHKTCLRSKALAAILEALVDVRVDHQGTIDQMDLGLAEQLSSNPRPVLQLVKVLVTRSESEAVPLRRFDTLTRRLVSGDRNLFHETLIEWLLTGERELCEGIKESIGASLGDKAVLQIDFARFDLNDVQKLFVCRKALGYFFFAPVTAASILVSVLGSAEPDLTQSVGDLLFDPLLINYGGEVRKYLESVVGDPRAGPAIRRALARLEGYLDDLRSVGEIPELRPSERHRQAERERWRELMRRSVEESESRSVFRDLVTRSTILYGRRTITHVVGPNEETRRVEIALQEHSMTFELPRMQMVDPQGLDYLLRVFRMERFRN
jgi:hypothetical protein